MNMETGTKTPTVATVEQSTPTAIADNGQLAHFLDPARYKHLKAVALDFAGSKIVPVRYQDKPCDCLIALELAARLGMHPLMVMQNVYTVHGTPGMQGQFVIALVNASGVFAAPLDWEYKGDGDSRICTCRAVRKRDGKTVELTMSITIAKAEGWYAQNPKWKNIPDQMLAYRSASWLARLHCPEVLLGLQTVEEIHDVIDIMPLPEVSAADAADALKKAAAGKKPGEPEETYACPDEDGIRIKASVCAKCPKAKDCPEYGPSHA